MNNKDTFYNEVNEIDLFEYWGIIKKRKHLIFTVVLFCVLSTFIVSLFQQNIFRSQAVILPVTNQRTVFSAFTQQANQIRELLGISGIETSEAEILALLESDILKEELIKRHNLLPILFPERWDEVRKIWKPPPRDLRFFVNKLIAKARGSHEDLNAVPSVWDGIKILKKIVTTKRDTKYGTITIQVDFPNPEKAAQLCELLIDTLKDYMCEEAIRSAETNKRYLEQELTTAADPFLRQKIYALIAQQVEIMTLAKIKESFAFKVIDPPRVPEEKVKPKRALMITTSLVLGLFLGILIVFLVEFAEKHREKEVTKRI